MDNYNRGGHSKYSLKVHIILVAKYRKKIFTSEKRSDCVKQSIFDASRKCGYNVIQIETDQDHIHILLEYTPSTSISQIVKHLKQYSTFQMWKYHKEYLSKCYWKHQGLWSDGYFACSVGQVSQEIIEKYIQNQG